MFVAAATPDAVPAANVLSSFLVAAATPTRLQSDQVALVIGDSLFDEAWTTVVPVVSEACDGLQLINYAHKGTDWLNISQTYSIIKMNGGGNWSTVLVCGGANDAYYGNTADEIYGSMKGCARPYYARAAEHRHVSPDTAPPRSQHEASAGELL